MQLSDYEQEPLTELVRELVELALGHEATASSPSPTRHNTGYIKGLAPMAPGTADDPLGAVVRWCDIDPIDEGPMSGTRVTVKDSISVGGVPMSCGMPMLEGFVPDVDSVVVDRLRRAGARVVAITNMDGLGMAASGETSGFGTTRNPVDTSRTAGGSSSGAAAGLSYEQIDVALGTDQGGSARVPASWCGVLGLKPTYGLVPYTGNAGIHPALDHVGPLARTTADLAALLTVIAGRDASDPRQRHVRIQATDYRRAVETSPDRLEGLRVGVLVEGIEASSGVQPDVAQAARETAERLADLGATVLDVSVPVHSHAGPISAALNIIGISAVLDGTSDPRGSAGRGFTQALMASLATRAEELPPHAKASWIASRVLDRWPGALALGQVRARRTAVRAAYDRAFDDVDVLLMPTTPFSAYCPPNDGDLSGLLERGWSMLANTEPFNVSGHPAISLPTGAVSSQSGPLAVGTMLVGRRFSDDVLLRSAASYERAYGWTSAEALTRAQEVTQTAHRRGVEFKAPSSFRRSQKAR